MVKYSNRKKNCVSDVFDSKIIHKGKKVCAPKAKKKKKKSVKSMFTNPVMILKNFSGVNSVKGGRESLLCFHN